jgi:hypothetical protein
MIAQVSSQVAGSNPKQTARILKQANKQFSLLKYQCDVIIILLLTRELYVLVFTI